MSVASVLLKAGPALASALKRFFFFCRGTGRRDGGVAAKLGDVMSKLFSGLRSLSFSFPNGASEQNASPGRRNVRRNVSVPAVTEQSSRQEDCYWGGGLNVETEEGTTS